MEQTTTSSIRVTGLLGLVALLIPMSAPAESLSVAVPDSPAGLAFARYIASIQERDPFADSGPVGVEIDASLPGLYKEARLLAVRETGESERSEYRVLQIEGDAIVAQEVIARYFLMQEQLEELPLSSITIAPENYKFRYRGEVGTGSALAYVYQITPRKKRDGLIQGQIWIDSVTGAATLQAGRFVKTPPLLPGKIDFVRNTELLGENRCIRITHVTIETPRAGRGQLTITEMPLTGPVEEPQRESLPLARQ
jgi:hypothetical protein